MSDVSEAVRLLNRHRDTAVPRRVERAVIRGIRRGEWSAEAALALVTLTSPGVVDVLLEVLAEGDERSERLASAVVPAALLRA